MTDLCNEIQKFGKGIGNTSRYRIVEALFKGPKTVTELVKTVKLSQPAVSQHLRTLKESSIVVDERKGQEVFYSLNTEYVLVLLKNLTAEVSKNKSK
jgi:DNA-binding transcriptional ArsR family regulator